MASIGETSRPGFVYDSATDTWIPVGIGPHSHTPAAIGAISNELVNAKGDIITATANDLPARLAVGNNGDTLVADSSQTTGLRYNPQNALANPVINGGFDIWQRGTSVSTTAGYTADRWYANMTVSGRTVSRQTTSDTTNLPNIQYCARVQRDSGGTNTSLVILSQPIETINSIPFVGKTVTMSFYARVGANFSATGSLVNANLLSGTGTDQNQQGAGYTGQVSITADNFTFSTTWQRYALVGTIPANATELATTFYYTPTGTAGAADYFEITGVQIDLGTYTATTAPTFRRSGGTIQGELGACYRYFQRIQDSSGGVDGYIANAFAYGTTAAYGVMQFIAPFRVNPTTTFTSGNYEVLQGNGTISSLSGVSVSNPTTTTQLIGGTTTGLTSGQALLMRTGSTAFVLDMSAEL
jgi:hypothetical protein